MLNNPVNLADLLGLDVYLFFWSSLQTQSGAGHVATGVGTESGMDVYDPYPSDGSGSSYKEPLKISGSMDKVTGSFHNKSDPELILKIVAENDKKVIERIEKLIKKVNSTWQVAQSNCADIAKEGIRSTDIDPGKSGVYSTPQELAQDIYENNRNSNLIFVIKGDWKTYRNSEGATKGIMYKIIMKITD